MLTQSIAAEIQTVIMRSFLQITRRISGPIIIGLIEQLHALDFTPIALMTGTKEEVMSIKGTNLPPVLDFVFFD